MKILFLNSWIHFKNENALINYKNIDFTIIRRIHEIDNHNLNEFDCVYSPSEPIDVSKYPNTKFIFGPHFSIFPDYRLIPIKGINSAYIQPSEWVKKDWSNNIKYNDITNDLIIKTLPFGVDTVKYNKNKTVVERQKVFIYFKQRDPNELKFIEDFINFNNIEYKIFSYNETYCENDYLNFLKDAKYGIWIGRHESQGFALQEALSCDVPLLVWNVKSMNQEYSSKYEDINATSIPYWDDRCGEFFYEKEELDETFNKAPAHGVLFL